LATYAYQAKLRVWWVHFNSCGRPEPRIWLRKRAWLRTLRVELVLGLEMPSGIGAYQVLLTTKPRFVAFVSPWVRKLALMGFVGVFKATLCFEGGAEIGRNALGFLMVLSVG